MTETPYETHFQIVDETASGTVTFNLTESEDGGTYWGYGHVAPKDFIIEVNKWITHTQGEDERIYSDPAELEKAGARVEHLWARANDDMADFELREPAGTESDAELFPVTRLWL